MSYIKQNFVDGAVLYASELNHIEDGIGNNTDNIGTLATTVQSQSEQIATLGTNKADKTKIVSVALSATWLGSASPYTQTVTLSGYTVTNNTKIDLEPSETIIAQLITDKVNGLLIKNNNGTLTAYAIGNKPSTALTVQGSASEVTA